MKYDNSATIWRNKYKTEGTKQPDWRGKATIGGQAFEVAGWDREGDRGAFIGLSFKVPDEKPKKEPPEPRTRQAAEALPDDLIPF